MTKTITDTITAILTAILIIALAAIILGFPLMWLWNWLMPNIFGLPFITFWQALGLNALSTILFKSTSLKSK
jgi:hypothetical protein